MKIVLLLFLNGLLAESAIPLKSWDLDSSFDRNYYFSLNSCLELAELGTKAQKIGTRKMKCSMMRVILSTTLQGTKIGREERLLARHLY